MAVVDLERDAGGATLGAAVSEGREHLTAELLPARPRSRPGQVGQREPTMGRRR